MDQPDARKTSSTGATVLVRRRPRRLQTTTPSNIVHGRVARSLTLTSHRVSADDTSTTPSTVNIRVRPVRSPKCELRRPHCALHTIRILYSSRTLGRLLCQHACTDLRLSLPHPPPTILKVAL